MTSCDWWNIKWNTKNGTENLYSTKGTSEHWTNDVEIISSASYFRFDIRNYHPPNLGWGEGGVVKPNVSRLPRSMVQDIPFIIGVYTIV